MGVSGGVWGLQVGFCAMVGGERTAFERLEPAVATLAPPDGYLYCGPAGAGHYVKMVHNGIEYGLMEAYGEGSTSSTPPTTRSTWRPLPACGTTAA